MLEDYLLNKKSHHQQYTRDDTYSYYYSIFVTVVLNHTHEWVVGFQPGAGAIGPLGSFPIDT